MAEVENISVAKAAAPAVALTATAPSLTVADAFVSPKGANRSSPTQEESSNSHLQYYEYDTTSDSENNEGYDDDDDDVEESLSGEYDDEETKADDDEEEEDEGGEGDMKPQVNCYAEAEKKFDEDRRNPQYTPRRGSFYEHDDRTDEVEGEFNEGEGGDDSECYIVGKHGSRIGYARGTKSTSTPTISSASKTMKKWPPVMSGKFWPNDRFDPSEQAPKTRSDLISAYGYDIRTEPPTARRGHRYGRGPSKYNRNWEDESAYFKKNNKKYKNRF